MTSCWNCSSLNEGTFCQVCGRSVTNDAAQDAAAEALRRITGFMEERNIRWFHTLGGLLLLAAGIGFLRSQWSTLGSYVVTLALLLAPLGAFYGAFRLRCSLPISSRLLSIVGGLLMPTGLLALRQFGIVSAPLALWSCGAFAFTTVVLAVLCRSLEEPACLYLSATSFALAAHHMALALHAPPAFGVTLFLAAFGLIVRGRNQSAALNAHSRHAAHALAGLALISTLPGMNRYGANHESLFLFFLGSVFFASAGYITRNVHALYGSAIAAAVLAFIVSPVLGVPHVFAAFVLLAMGTVYSLGEFAMKPSEGWRNVSGGDSRALLKDASTRLAMWLTGIGLTVVFGVDLLELLRDGFSAQPLSHVLGSLGVACLGATYYGVVAATMKRPLAVYWSAACSVYAWFIATSWLHHGQPGLEALTLSGLPLLILACAWLLRSLIPAVFLEPWVDVAMLVSLVVAPLSLGAWSSDTGQWTLALTALFHFLWVAWRRQPAFMYLGLLCSGLSYGLAHHPALDTLGMKFLPACAFLGLAARSVERRWGHAYAIPMARMAMAVSTAVVLLQAVLWTRGQAQEVAVTLLCAAVGMALFAPFYRTWAVFDRTAEEVLALGACLVAPAGVLAAVTPFQQVAAGSATMLVMFALGRRLGPAWRTASRLGLLGWMPVLLACPSSSDGSVALLQRAIPAAAWLGVALLEGRATIGMGSAILLFIGFLIHAGLAADPLVRAAVLAAFALGWTRLCRVDPRFAVPAWVAAGRAWSCVLTVAGVSQVHRIYAFWPFTAALGLIWWCWRPKYVGGLALLTVVGLTVSAVSTAPESAFPLTIGVHAVGCALLALAVDRRHGRTAAIGAARAAALLVPGGFVVLYMRDLIQPDAMALALGVFAVAWVLVGWIVRATVFGQPLRHASSLCAVFGGFVGLCAVTPGVHEASAAVLLAATALALHGALHGVRAGYHGAYVLCHGVLLCNVPEPRAVEWYTAPLGVWLLAWSARYTEPDVTGALEVVGSLLVGLPSLAMSFAEQGNAHALCASVAGLLLFLQGAGRGRLFPSVAGSALVLLEALLQVHRVLASMPWQIYATVAGLFLIALGLFFERRRQQIIVLGGRLLAQWTPPTDVSQRPRSWLCRVFRRARAEGRPGGCS